MATETSVQAKPAGLGRRIGAMLYDSLLVIAILAVTGYIATALNGFKPVHGAMWQSLLFVEAFAYFAWSWCTTGQTIGMMAWRLHAVSTKPKLSLDEASYRVMGALVSFLCFGLGFFWLLIDKQNRTWSDLMSNTKILHEPKAQKV